MDMAVPKTLLTAAKP